MSRETNIIILDEFLENKSGHYYEYDKTVMESLHKYGIQTTLYARDIIAADISAELDAKPYFQYNPNLGIRKIPVIGSFLYRFYNWQQLAKQLTSVIDKEKTSGKKVVFFAPNIFWYNMLPYAMAFRKTGIEGIILFRTSVLEAIDIPQSFKPLIFYIYNRAIRMFTSNPNMRFVTDSEVIAEQFTAKYAKPMTVLPIPHVFAMDDTGGIEKEIYTLFLPGPARIEKGIETIVAAMSYLHQHHPQILLRLKLVLQFFGEKERAILEQLKLILQALPLQLEFLEKLSSEEYKARFMQADIILIPYLNSRGYKARTSGVLAEAIAASKPFITTKDSWMHAQAINYKTGFAVQDEDEKALAEGIMEMVNHFTRFKNQAISAKQPWLEFHSKDNFYNVFKGLMQGG